MLKTMLMVDNSGLIVSYGNDGGDSCCRNYTFHLRNEILNQLSLPQSSSTSIVAKYKRTQAILEESSGCYVRNPNPDIYGNKMWYNDPNTTSRDQLTPVICYLAYMSYHGDPDADAALQRLVIACDKRYQFAQNNRAADGTKKIPDFMTPDLWSIQMRAHGKLLLPIIAVCDAFIFLSVVAKLWGPVVKDGTFNFRLPGPTDTDDENTNNVLMAAQYTYDTPFSWLARKLYKKFRRPTIGNTQYGQTNNIMGALVSYSTDNWCPEMAEMARPIVERY